MLDSAPHVSPRNSLDEYGPDSPVFQAWASIHKDFKSTARDGSRTVLTLAPGFGTVLTRWHGPNVLAALRAALQTD